MLKSLSLSRFFFCCHETNQNLFKFWSEEIFNLQFFVKIELNTAAQEDEQHDSINEEIEAEIKRFYATEYLNEET